MGGYHRMLPAASRRAEPADVPPEARARGAEMLAQVEGKPMLPGDTDSVGGWHIETHTLGCRNAADEPEGEWLDSHWRIFDEYAADPDSAVVGDPEGGAAFLTFTRMRRRAGNQAGGAAEQAHADMAEALRGIGVSDLNGLCLEASCLLCAALRARGEGAKLVRRWAGERGGHWSVETKDGEFDPTVAYWDDAPPGAVRGRLYRVVEDSPHMRWERDGDVNEAAAVAVAEAEFGGDLPDLLKGARTPSAGGEKMSYARMSKLAQRHQPTTDVRHPAYELGDKLAALKGAVGAEPVMREDGPLLAALARLEQARRAVMDHLDAHYLWD